MENCALQTGKGSLSHGGGRAAWHKRYTKPQGDSSENHQQSFHAIPTLGTWPKERESAQARIICSPCLQQLHSSQRRYGINPKSSSAAWGKMHDGLLLHHKKDEALTLSNKMHEPEITVLRETDQPEKSNHAFSTVWKSTQSIKPVQGHSIRVITNAASPIRACTQRTSVLHVLITAVTLSLGGR